MVKSAPESISLSYAAFNSLLKKTIMYTPSLNPASQPEEQPEGKIQKTVFGIQKIWKNSQ